MKGFVRGHFFKPEAQGRSEMAGRKEPPGGTLAMITESDLCFDQSLCEFSKNLSASLKFEIFRIILTATYNTITSVISQMAEMCLARGSFSLL